MNAEVRDPTPRGDLKPKGSTKAERYKAIAHHTTQLRGESKSAARKLEVRALLQSVQGPGSGGAASTL
jgi:hypothetical protein